MELGRLRLSGLVAALGLTVVHSMGSAVASTGTTTDTMTGSGTSTGVQTGTHTGVGTGTGTVTGTEVITRCSDGIDNDQDGLVDMQDPDCQSSDDDGERDPVAPTQPECSDGYDNDLDGLVDTDDPGCGNASDSSERDDVAPYSFPAFPGTTPERRNLPRNRACIADTKLGICQLFWDKELHCDPEPFAVEMCEIHMESTFEGRATSPQGNLGSAQFLQATWNSTCVGYFRAHPDEGTRARCGKPAAVRDCFCAAYCQTHVAVDFGIPMARRLWGPWRKCEDWIDRWIRNGRRPAANW